MAKIDRSILQANDQSMGQYGDPDKIESSIIHLADKIDENDNGFNTHKDAVELAHPDKSVTERKLADSSVSSRTIQPGAVGTRELDPAILSQPTTAAGVQAKLQDHDEQLADIAVNVRMFGAKGDGITDDTNAIQSAIDYCNDIVISGSASYNGGATVLLPKGTYLISNRLKLYALIQLKGVGSFSSVLKAKSTWTDGVYMIGASYELDGRTTLRPAVGLRDLGFDHNNTGARGFIGHALNDNSVFENIRSFNFRKNILTLDRGVGGGTVSQGWTIKDWHAITQYDIEEDVFVTKEANEGIFLACKALGLSNGVSAATGFHIGAGKISEGVQIVGSSAAHLPNGKGIRFNHARDCYAYKNTLENLMTDIYIGHDTTNANCSKVEARGNRHYPTINAPAAHRDIVIDMAVSAIAEARENAFIDITANAVNSQAILPTNRATATTLPSTVTNASDSSIVQEYHKNGVAFHHKNGSFSTNAGASQFDITLPNGSVVRSDQYNASLISATGKGARVVSNGGSVTIDGTGNIVASSASGKAVTLQENGVSKISLDGFGRIRIFGLSTTAPGVTDALYKDSSGNLKIT